MVEIKRLGPDTEKDFLQFMDGPAFETNPNWSACYCQFYLNTEAENEQATKEFSRQQACDRIQNRIMNGYLAYEGDTAIGWVAANAAKNFRLLPSEETKTARILCFVVAPNFQNQGIATQLLNFAIQDLKNQGFEKVEAAPLKSDEHNKTSYRGKLSMFKKLGFEELRMVDDKHVLIHRNL
ncbi:MAG: GNAT family N-acetyltransferase [Micrococcales bacterium]